MPRLFWKQTTMLDRAHNSPPDPIDEALLPYGGAIAEAEAWLDGALVENEDQMHAVDALLKDVKAAKKALTNAEESEAKPIYDQWKAAKARFKPSIDDVSRIATGLASIVSDFKNKLAEKKAEEQRRARAAADRLDREARQAVLTAQAGDIEAQREADAIAQAAKDAKAKAAVLSKDKVKGLRKVHRYEIEDHKAALHWIAKNDRGAMTVFIQNYVASNSKTKPIDGVRCWEEKEAF